SDEGISTDLIGLGGAVPGTSGASRQPRSANLDSLGGLLAAGNQLKRSFNGYQNGLMATRPGGARTMVYATPGAGAAIQGEGLSLLRAVILDAEDHTTTSGLNDMFHRGALLYGDVNVPVPVFGLIGLHTLSYIYSTQNYSMLGESSFLHIPGNGALA